MGDDASRLRRHWLHDLSSEIKAAEIGTVIDAYVKAFGTPNWTSNWRAWGKGIDEHCHGQSANRRYFRAAISETSDPQPVLNCFFDAVPATVEPRPAAVCRPL